MCYPILLAMQDGDTPLHVAFRPKHPDAVEEHDEKLRFHNLQEQSQLNQERGVRVLVEFKCDPNFRNKVLSLHDRV